MQPNTFDGESEDDLNDDDFEKCVLMENEILSQNPSLQQNICEVIKKNDRNWVNANNSFFPSVSSSPPKNRFEGDRNSNFKKPNGNCKTKSSPKLSQKSSKYNASYKPLNFESSIAAKRNIAHDTSSIDFKLESVLKEKAKLEEDNLIKQGEIANLRCEIKRKEANLEFQRLSHNAAIEAAEKRGEEKTSKFLHETETKRKVLEEKLNKLQGNLSFKNKEMDELSEQYRRLQDTSNMSQNEPFRTPAPPPASKKRKMSPKLSQTTSCSAFGDMFDFGNSKKVVMDVTVQTDFPSSAKEREKLHTNCPKAAFSLNRRAFHWLSTWSRTRRSSAGLESQPIKASDDLVQSSDIVSRLIASESVDSDEGVVEALCERLNRIADQLSSSSGVGSRPTADGKSSAGEPGATAASFYLSLVCQLELKTDEEVRDVFLVLNRLLASFIQTADNEQAIHSALQTYAHLGRRSSTLSEDILQNINGLLRDVCKISTGSTLGHLLDAVNSFAVVEVFQRLLCMNRPGVCLMKNLCDAIRRHTSKTSFVLVTKINEFVDMVTLKFPSSSFNPSNPLTCNCPFDLLEAYIGQLFTLSEQANGEMELQPIITGIRILHLWLVNEKSWWESFTQLVSYSALMSNIVRISRPLRANGAMDQHTWEMLCYLYNVDKEET